MHPYATTDMPPAPTGPGTAPGTTALPVRTHRTRPGPATQERSLILGPVTSSAGCARSTVHEALTAWGLARLAEPAEAITSELVANAVHASTDKAPPGTPPRQVTLRITVERGHGELCMRVWDPDPTPPPPDPALPDDDAESGRGLFIVAALSSRWGWHPAPNGGKFVWSALTLPPQPPATPPSPQP